MSTAIEDLPIGILDSGLGGLSVAKAIREALPHENFIYAADCGFAPWGDRDNAFILSRLDTLVGFLLRQPIKALVLACNTATTVGIHHLRQRLSLPIIGIEPAVLPAARATTTHVIATMATVKTLHTERYLALKEQASALGASVIDIPCPGLMECVEAGQFDALDTLSLIHRFLDPVTQNSPVDHIVLGCTHYPFLTQQIQSVAGKAVTLIDPAPAVAKQLKHRLCEESLLNSSTMPGQEHFYITRANAAHEQVLKTLWRTTSVVNCLEE